MSSELKIFNHQDLGRIRAINKNDEPLFCLSDVCKILELSNPSMVKESIITEFELPKLNIGSFDYGVKEFNNE